MNKIFEVGDIILEPKLTSIVTKKELTMNNTTFYTIWHVSYQNEWWKTTTPQETVNIGYRHYAFLIRNGKKVWVRN